MSALATVAFYLGVIAYSAASTLFFLDLARGNALGPRSAWGPRVLALGAVVHAVHVVVASLVLDRCPVASLHFGLSFSALVAVAAFLLLRRHANLDPMGVLVAPIALTFLIGAQFVGAALEPEMAVSHPLLVLHVTANVLGLGIFVVAGAALARTLFGFTTWFLLAGVLVLRRIAGVRGRRAAYGTVAGVVCVLLVVVIYAVRPGVGS